MAFHYVCNLKDAVWDSLRGTAAGRELKPVPVLLTTISGSLAVVYLYKAWKNRGKGLPPSPRGWPVLGNLLEVSDDKMHEDFMRIQQKNKLPDMFTLNLGPGNTLVVLNSYEVIKDAFVTQGDLFANRPYTTGLAAMALKDAIFTKDYLDPTWNEGKTFMMSALRSTGFGSTKSAEEKILEQVALLENYFTSSTKAGQAIDIHDIIPKVSANIIFEIVFGKVYRLDEQELLDRVQVIRDFYDEGKDFVILDFFPVWFSNIFLRHRIRNVRKRTDDIRRFIKADVMEHQQSLDPENPKDFVDMCLSKKDGPIDIDVLTDTLFTFLPDAIDNLGSTINWVLLYMGHYPEVQSKLQEEVNKVTGGNRHVTWADRPQLPYAEAAIMEVFRVACPVATTVLHTPIRDTFFRGYFFPVGTALIANLYSALIDPKHFKDPDVFKPERFLDGSGQLVRNEAWIPFSMGRRKCLGEQIVRIEVILLVTNILQRYELSFPPGEPLPSLEAINNIVSRVPKPFKMILKDRC